MGTFFSEVHKDVLLYSFWWNKEHSDGYDLVICRDTGRIEEDHGDMDSENIVYVTVTALTTLSQLELEDAGIKYLFGPFYEEIGATFCAGDDLIFSAKEEGESIFAFDFSGGVTESTPDGPGEGWSEIDYLGPLESFLSGGMQNAHAAVMDFARHIHGSDFDQGNSLSDTLTVATRWWNKNKKKYVK